MPKKLDHTAAIAHLSSVDKKLARIIAKSALITLQPEKTQSIFEALLESIIYQQLNGKVAATITGRVKAAFRGPVPSQNAGHSRPRGQDA